MIKHSKEYLEGKNNFFDVGEIISLNKRPIQPGCISNVSSKIVPVSYNIELHTKPEFLRNVPIGNFSEGDDSEVYPVGTLVYIGYINSGEPFVLKRAPSTILSDYVHSRSIPLKEGEKVIATKHGNDIRFLDDGRIIIDGVTRDRMTKEEINVSLTLGGNQGKDIITHSDYILGMRAKGSFLGFDKLGNFFLKLLKGFINARVLKFSALDKIVIAVHSVLGRIIIDSGSNILIKAGQNIHAFVGTSEEDYPDEIVSTYLNSHGVTYFKGERLVIDLTGTDDTVKELEIIAHKKDASIKIKKGDMAIDVDTGKMSITVHGNVHLKAENIILQEGNSLILTDNVVCPVTGSKHIPTQYTVKAKP